MVEGFFGELNVASCLESRCTVTENIELTILSIVYELMGHLFSDAVMSRVWLLYHVCLNIQLA